jgi:NAD(P)-dependent dehydrogenase (short-subunit alcohol dehydrogenase family)
MIKDKIILITGGNAGMGKATAIELAKLGAHVIIMCRNKERGEKALKEIKAESGNNSAELMLCDLGSQKSIREFVEKFKEKYNRLDILINNAGVILPKRQETLDGYEMQFGVNHLGQFLLTNLLLDYLKQSAPSRIINVASGAHVVGKIYFEDVNLRNNYKTFRAYAQSKLANILFTYELAERLKGTGVSVNCLHPGAVATQMGINRETGFGTFVTGLLKPFFQVPAKGAETAVYLATSDEISNTTGLYFYKKKPTNSSKASHNKEAAKKLWEMSMKMTGLG